MPRWTESLAGSSRNPIGVRINGSRPALPRKGFLLRLRAYHLAMSRIGTFPDDDLAGWILKSPELGSAIGAFANAVYSKNRLPMRTRELARTVIAHENECE